MSRPLFLCGAKKIIELISCLILVLLLMTLQTVYAGSHSYYLCGPDEDGCPPGQEQYCMCIPVSVNAEQPYCLDLDNMTCKPAAERPDCGIILKNQVSCLATMLQSEPNPPCPTVTQSFCHKHSVYMCDEDGNPNSCKKPV